MAYINQCNKLYFGDSTIGFEHPPGYANQAVVYDVYGAPLPMGLHPTDLNNLEYHLPDGSLGTIPGHD